MKLHQRQNPYRAAFTPAVLARAAWLLGRGFPVDHVAEQLRVNARALKTELNRLGIDREQVAHMETDPNLVLQIRLTQAERQTLGGAALDREMYRPALGALILRTALQGGKPFVDAILDDVGHR